MLQAKSQSRAIADFVEVWGIWSGKKNAKPDVVPELSFKDGHWVFENFHYGKDDSGNESDLLIVLKGLKTERKKNPN